MIEVFNLGSKPVTSTADRRDRCLVNLNFDPSLLHDDGGDKPIIKVSTPQKKVTKSRVVAQVHQAGSGGKDGIYDVPKVCKRIDFGADSIMAVDESGNICSPGSCHNATDLLDASASRSLVAAGGGGKSPVADSGRENASLGGGSVSAGAAANDGAMAGGSGLTACNVGTPSISLGKTSSGGGNEINTSNSVEPVVDKASAGDVSSAGSGETVIEMDVAVNSNGEAAKASKEAAKSPEGAAKSPGKAAESPKGGRIYVVFVFLFKM